VAGVNTGKWNKPAILLAIVRHHHETGTTPTARQWRSAGKTHPSAQTVREHFGSWDEAIRAAGFKPRGVGRPKGTTGRRLEKRDLSAFVPKTDG
jgi:hypothetical protein